MKKKGPENGGQESKKPDFRAAPKAKARKDVSPVHIIIHVMFIIYLHSLI